MSEYIEAGQPLQFTDPNTPTRVGEMVENVSDIYNIPSPRLGMQVFVKSEKKSFVITSLKSKVIGGVDVPEAAVEAFEPAGAKSITWNNDTDPSNMNDFVVAGVYDIKGEHKRVDDNLPILNTGGGHSFNARLTVLDSSISGSGEDDDKCITQVLSFSNRLGQGEVYIRTGKGSSLDNLTWEKWSTLQRNVNVGEVDSLDDLKDNGIYSGVWLQGHLNSYPLTFVCVVINDYFIGIAPRRISQFVYGLSKFDGSVAYQSRVWDDSKDKWGDWEILNREEISSMIKSLVENAIKGVIADAPEAFDTLKEIADWIANDETGAVALANAISANTEAINTIDDKLDEEIERSVTADQNLLRSIDEEVRRATAAEQGIEAKALDASSAEYEATENTVVLKFATIEGVGDEATIPAATTTTAGVMSAEDKKKIDNISSDGEGGGSAIEIINDLTTGGADKALSAEMGKALDGNLAKLDQELKALKARVSALEGNEEPSEPDAPVETRYTINASADNGVVAASVNGVSVDLPYKALKNEVVKLEVLADSGYQFVAWSDGMTENPREIEVVTDVAYFAVCEISVKTYTLRATADNGSVVAKVNGSAVALPYTAPVNTEVELDVQPIEGYEFTEWSNASSDNPRIVRMTTDKRMNASCELAGNIPADYRILRGMYSNNKNSYLDTGAAIDSHSNWDLYFGRTTLVAGNNVLFGIRRASGTSDTKANAFYHNSASSWSHVAWVYGGADSGAIKASGFGNKFYGNKHKLSQKGNDLYEWDRLICHIEKDFNNTDGVTAFFGNLAKAKTTPYNTDISGTAILYRFVLYDENKTIVKDLRPVQRVEDGTFGAYDIISGVFIPCVGTWNEWAEESASLRVVGMPNHSPSISSTSTQTASYYMGYFVTTQDRQEDFIVQSGEITTDGSTISYPARQKLTCAEYNNNWHGNTAWFGADKWDASDYFPLLYVSTDKGNQLLCVYRIIGANPDALEGIELVQKIHTQRETPWYYNNYYGMAGANTFVHTGYTQDSFSSADNGNTIMARVFRLPDPTIGDVTLSETDALVEADLGFQSTTGDGYWTGKYLAITFSYPGNGVGKYVIWEIGNNNDTPIAPAYVIDGFHTSSSDAYLTGAELEGFKYNPFDDVFSLCFEPQDSGRTNLVYYRPYSEYTEIKQW